MTVVCCLLEAALPQWRSGAAGAQPSRCCFMQVINCIFESAQQVQLPLYTSMSVMGKAGVCEHVMCQHVMCQQTVLYVAQPRQFRVIKIKDRRDPARDMCSEHNWRSGMCPSR